VESSGECEMNLRVPENAGNLPSGCTTGGLSSNAQLHSQSVSSIPFSLSIFCTFL
jgi:hypothetical protein